MKPKVLILPKKEVSQLAAEILLNQVKKNPRSVLGLATGHTMKPVYAYLAKLAKKHKVSFEKVKTFNLDQHIGVPENNIHNFRKAMSVNFFNKINIKKENTFFPPTNAKNPQIYDAQINKAGGIDLQFLGLGVNGHIAYNEPGTPFNSKTHYMKMRPETMINNFGKNYKSKKNLPTSGATMGLATILKAKKIVLVATGKHKARAVRALLNGPLSPSCPASILRKHKDVLIILDKEAASLLK